FEGVHVLQHRGGGVAPWNIQQFAFRKENGKIKGTELATMSEFDLVFVHFHDIKFYTNGQVDLSIYTLTPDDLELIYKPYLRHLEEIKANIQSFGKIDPHGTKANGPFIMDGLRRLKRKAKGVDNRFLLKDLLK